MVGYLDRHKISPIMPIEAVPIDVLREIVRQHAAPAATRPGAEERTVFLMQPLLERAVISEPDLIKTLRAFLDRRPARRYVIKDHPQPSPGTMALVTDQLKARGLTFEIAPDDSRLIELALPSFGCGEVTSCYSWGAMVCNRIYGIPYDTMLPELSRDLDILSEGHRKMVAFLHDYFRVNTA